MRMDFSGTIYLIAGVLGNAITILFTVGHGWIVAAFGSFVMFLSWLFIFTGAGYLWQVYKDKKSRKSRNIPLDLGAKPP